MSVRACARLAKQGKGDELSFPYSVIAFEGRLAFD